MEPQPSEIADAGASTYVDQVITYTQDGVPVTCTEELAPVCQAPTGCPDHEVLGAPDGRTLTLDNGAQLEVGFLCDPIVDRAPNSDFSPDFIIWATIEQGPGAIVSVSEDGTDYVILDNLISDDQRFDLGIRGYEYARFVQIVAEPGTTVLVDAIEVLP